MIKYTNRIFHHRKSGIKLRGASFLMHKIYEDQITLKLIITTAEVAAKKNKVITGEDKKLLFIYTLRQPLSGLDLETCLEAFGTYFLEYCQNNGYDQILRVLGSNLPDFLTNLDNLHDHLGSIYPGMRAPSFRVTTTENGVLHLHYYSERKGLSAIVRGLVVAVAKQFFNVEVTVTKLESDDNSDHEILEVTRKVFPNSQDSTDLGNSLPLKSELTNVSNDPKDSLLSASVFCSAFPFHVMFDKKFKIIALGNSMRRIIRPKLCKKVTFIDIFQITRPVIENTYQAILDYLNQVFVVKMNEEYLNCCRKDVILRFKGQMIPVPEANAVLFMCSPRVADISELSAFGLYLSDFPVHDRTRELLLMAHGRKGERELVEKLDEATNHLRILDSKLREENKKTEEILHNIFPAKIATLLCQNVTVFPEHVEPVSCLFSDIQGFTAMCGDPKLVPMDIVRLLNKLYLQFDNLSNLLGVYKVETIGDAYVVVGGLPEYVADHADRVVAMALGMVKITETVMSPVDGKPIRMRIGIHSGAVMAGIVGIQMPRYCLFGNTVTLSNKMESTSRPGEVHISDAAVKFTLKQRSHHLSNEESVKRDGNDRSISNDPRNLQIPMSTFCKALPFHFIADHNLKCIQLGQGLMRIFETKCKIFGSHVSSLFIFEKPSFSEISLEAIISKTNFTFILGIRESCCRNQQTKGIKIKGQMIHCQESNCVMFLGSPVIDGLESMTSKGLYLSDIPIHDATRDIILIEEQTRAQESLKRRMDTLRKSIQEANHAVSLERKKNVDLLELIFPAPIAKQLWLGKVVEAQQYDKVTMLFSDIVGFTAICSTATPMMVVDMLNTLYTQFDAFCGEIDVYKVETIGDAYCVAAGLHRNSCIHAQRAALMALKMIKTVQTVCSHDGNPLQMRIGLHTGSVLAGIVGVKMPRYCLFGNNVSIANKFESKSEALRINVSPTTYRLLSEWKGFEFTERSRDALPSEFPSDIPGNCYFLDDYRHPNLDSNDPLFAHIAAALREYATESTSVSLIVVLT
ncbi:guanylate cyclase beta 1 subunit-like protein [Leptotrombidium deliense]|uniref:guanylate cyclase n=1 Tax=Leptotrombidium deliense TaxID=299467 RepID=A0A443SWT2_9ACAR|nr:guanylate cyclase beta 1 subunit-like protein [Leptotrombidium deliense]